MEIVAHSKSLKFPDFLIVGAAKSGTSSLHKYLIFHSKIFMPEKKELWYLHLRENPNQEILTRRPDLPKNILDYTDHFKHAGPDQFLGESTPSYLMFPDLTITSLKNLTPDYRKIKIIMVLREPLSRILSLYNFNLRIRTEYLTLSLALQNESERTATNNVPLGYYYLQSSLYFNSVKKYMENFDEVLILTYDEFKSNIQNTLKKTCKYLNIDDSEYTDLFYSEMKHHNSTNYIKKNGKINLLNPRAYYDFIKYIPETINLPYFFKRQYAFFRYYESDFSNVDKNVLDSLLVNIKSDVEKLQQLTQIDLSSWIRQY